MAYCQRIEKSSSNRSCAELKEENMKNLRRILSIWTILVVLGLSAFPAWADAGHPHDAPKVSKPHAHEAPHGGKMLSAGKHHVEVLVEKGEIIKVYFYDNQNHPLSTEGISGKIHLTLSDKHRESLELQPAADQSYLVARMTETLDPRSKAVLSLLIDGRRQNIRFKL